MSETFDKKILRTSFYVTESEVCPACMWFKMSLSLSNAGFGNSLRIQIGL